MTNFNNRKNNKCSILDYMYNCMTVSHALLQCVKNSRAAQFLLDLVRIYDSSVTEDKVLKFQIHTDPLYEQQAAVILYTGLSLIWKNRQHS